MAVHRGCTQLVSRNIYTLVILGGSYGKYKIYK